MTLIHRILPGLLLATLPSALASQGAQDTQNAQGLAYSMAVAIDSGSHKTSMAIAVEVLGSKLRMSTKADIAGAPFDMYMIVDSAAGTFTTVFPAQSMVNVASSSLLSDPAAVGYSMELAGVPKFDVVDLGAGEPILGHTTRHYRLTASYVTRTTIGTDVCSNPTSGVTDFWTTSEIDAPNMLASMRRFFPGVARDPIVGSLDSIWKVTMKGVVLRQVATGSIVLAGEDTIHVRSSWELTDLKPGSVDPKDFEIPQDYRVMDMREMMPGVDPEILKQAKDAAQASLRERYKKQFCGSSGAGNP
jgi:hypothetical protein